MFKPSPQQEEFQQVVDGIKRDYPGAVRATIVSFFIVWPIGFYLYNAGIIPKRYKDAGTLAELAIFGSVFLISRTISIWLKRRSEKKPRVN